MQQQNKFELIVSPSPQVQLMNTNKALTLQDSTKIAVRSYLANLNGQDTTDLYELVLSEIEKPMLDMVMQYTRGNQTRAANMLGINRGTLRKKLKKYNMG